MWIPDLLLISSNATEVRLEYQNKNAINLNSFRKISETYLAGVKTGKKYFKIQTTGQREEIIRNNE